MLQIGPGLLEDYRENSEIGKGKFGSVVLKKFRGTPVAVKYFHETTSVKMVEREAKFLQQCSHLNLPIIFGMHSKTSPYFIVTQAYGNDELSMSTTLYDAIKGGAVSISNFKPEELLHVVSQLMEALSYINERNILHTDIKSDNIALAKNGDFQTPILIDFGKACLFADVKRKVLSEKEQKIYRDNRSHIAPEVVNGTPPPASRVMYIQLVSFSLNCTDKTN